MTESLFRQYAREAMELSAQVQRGEQDIYASLAYTWALAALIEEKLAAGLWPPINVRA